MMYSGKLFLWLDTLSRSEKNRFRDYLYSPLFNKNEDTRRFLDILYNDPDKQLSKEEVFLALFPGQKFEPRKITDQVFYLTRHLEDFLALQKFNQNTILQKINLLAESQERHLDKMVHSTAQNIEEELNGKEYRDHVYYYHDYLYQSELDKYHIGKERVQRDVSLQKKTDSLDIFYITAKLRDCCEMLNRTRIIQSEYRMPMLEPIKEYIERYLSDYEKYPAIGIYYLILQMLQTPAETEYFTRLVAMLETSHSYFPAEELRDMYIYAQNYCIGKINAGESDYYRHLFNLTKKLLESDLVLSGNQITQRDYKNIASMALRLGEHEWALDFINRYKARLPTGHRQNAYAYNLANYYFETRNYSTAIRLLRDVEFTDVYYNLDAKSMLLKIYYEQDEEETFLALAAAFKIYLTRNKLINEQNFTGYNNLLKYAKKAFHFKTMLPYERRKDFGKKVSLLKDKIAESKNTINSKWLLEQVNQLIGNVN